MLRDDSHPPGSAPALGQMASTFWLVCVMNFSKRLVKIYEIKTALRV